MRAYSATDVRILQRPDHREDIRDRHLEAVARQAGDRGGRDSAHCASGRSCTGGASVLARVVRAVQRRLQPAGRSLSHRRQHLLCRRAEHRVLSDRHAAGNILIDSGTGMHDGIIAGIERLGYQVSDMRILLSSHAHFDHVEGHALMHRRTAAQVMAIAADAEALESGHDSSALGAIGWEPVRVSRRLKDGDTVTLGGTTLRAIHAPGHTPGATIWMTTVEDAGRRYNVAFLTTTTPNAEVPLANPRHMSVIEDTRSTFRKLKGEREPDIVLVGHPHAMFAGTIERMRRGERPHPLLNGAKAWTATTGNRRGCLRAARGTRTTQR